MRKTTVVVLVAMLLIGKHAGAQASSNIHDIPSPAITTPGSDAQRPRMPGLGQFPIAVFNTAFVPSGVLRKAEAEVSAMFASDSLQPVWIECPSPESACTRPAEDGDVFLRLVPGGDKRSRGGADVGGNAAGAYATVFWNHVEEMKKLTEADLYEVLAVVIAHEIGHLLLGPNMHSPNGIMRAHWHTTELNRAARERPRFSAEQAQKIRERLRDVAERRASAAQQ